MIVIVVLGVVVRVVGGAALHFRLTDSLSVPWLMFVPLIAATMIGLCVGSEMSDWERQADRSMRTYAVGMLGTLFGLSVLVTSIAAGDLHGAYTSSAAVRNLCGFTGMALISAVLLGATLSWVLPLAYGVISVIGGGQGGQVQVWAWPAVADGHSLATAQALGWLAIGLWLAVAVYFRQDAT